MYALWLKIADHAGCKVVVGNSTITLMKLMAISPSNTVIVAKL